MNTYHKHIPNLFLTKCAYAGLKSGKVQRDHSFLLAYAKYDLVVICGGK
jgi:hypothetical protein